MGLDFSRGASLSKHCDQVRSRVHSLGSGAILGMILAALVVGPWIAFYSFGPAPLLLDVAVVFSRMWLFPFAVSSLLVAAVTLLPPLSRLRSAALFSAGVLVGMWLVCWAGPKVGLYSRLHVLSGVVSEGNVVREAIKAFEESSGRLPSTLQELVPGFLPELPSTGLSRYPDFEYHANDVNDSECWELAVDCSNGFERDRLVYRPKGDYSLFNDGGRICRIRDWAYVLE